MNRNRLRTRLTSAAHQECDTILMPMKKKYPQLKPVSVRFEDLPDKEMVKRGLPAESKSTYVEPEIVLFLFNIYEERIEAAEYRARVRRVLLAEIGDLIGEDIRIED
jgi:hypothetical protein